MHRGHTQTLFLYVLLFLLTGHLYATVEWQLVGLDSLSVNCLVVRGTGSRTYFLTGTDRGFFFKGKKEIRLIRDTIPGNDLVIAKNGFAVALAGDGSDSDGVFLGEDIIDGEPYWAFRRSQLLPFPQSLNAQSAVTSGKLFLGHQNNIQKMSMSTGTFGFQKEMVLPLNCFGDVKPLCAALHVFSRDKRLYAGGYDLERNSRVPASLIFQKNEQSDTLSTLRPLEVTAITEMFTETEGLQLYIGTKQSGIYHFADPYDSLPWGQFPTPNNETVNDMITIPTMLMSQMLCVAVNSGVFLRVHDTWQELGDLPKIPNCLALALKAVSWPEYVVYAGTNEGIYYLDSLAVPIDKKLPTKSCPGKELKVTGHDGVLSITVTLERTQDIQVAIVDMLGRTVSTPVVSHLSAGRQVFRVAMHNGNGKKISNGMYLVKVSFGRKQFHKKVLLAK